MYFFSECSIILLAIIVNNSDTKFDMAKEKSRYYILENILHTSTGFEKCRDPHRPDFAVTVSHSRTRPEQKLFPSTLRHKCKMEYFWVLMSTCLLDKWSCFALPSIIIQRAKMHNLAAVIQFSLLSFVT